MAILMARLVSHRRDRVDASADAGASLAEFALVIPLFLAMIWGLVTLVSIARARMQVAILAHAVMREAEAGIVEPAALTGLAKSYGRACGMGRAAVDSISVEVGDGGGGIEAGGAALFDRVARRAAGSTRIAVRARVPVPDGLRLLTGPLEAACSNVCVAGTWKQPWGMLKELVSLPDPRKEKKGQ